VYIMSKYIHRVWSGRQYEPTLDQVVCRCLHTMHSMRSRTADCVYHHKFKSVCAACIAGQLYVVHGEPWGGRLVAMVSPWTARLVAMMALGVAAS